MKRGRPAASPTDPHDAPPDSRAQQRWPRSSAGHLDSAAILVSLLCSALTLAVMFRYPHPTGWDPGQWLSMAEVYLGRSHATFTPDRYPPIFFALLAGILLLVGDPFVSLFIVVAGLFFIIPLSAYASFVLATGDRRSALLFAPLVALSQPLMDMLAWGGYPNLTSIPFFMLTFAFLVRTTRDGAKRRDFMILGLAAALVFLSHPLASVLLGVGGLTFAVAWLSRSRDLKWFKRLVIFSAPVFAVLYLPFFAVYALGPNAPSYVTSQPIYSLDFALYPIVPWWMRGLFPFDVRVTIAAVAGAVLVALFPAIQMSRGKPATAFAMLLKDYPGPLRTSSYLVFLVTFVPPLVLPVVSWAAQQYTDFGRIVYFVTIPVAAAAAKGLTRFRDQDLRAALRSRLERTIARPLALLFNREQWSRAMVVAFAVGYAISGFTYLELASQYFLAFDTPDHLALAEWVNENTATTDVVLLSPEPENQPNLKWLGGLTGRNTLGLYDARQLFYDQERHDNLDIYEIFNNRYAITNDAIEVSTQGASATSAFRLRVSSLEFFTPRPALDLLDIQSLVVRSSGPPISFAEFPVRNASLGNAGGEWQLSLHRAGRGLDFWQNATVSHATVSVTFHFVGTAADVRGITLAPVSPAPACGFEDAGTAVTWRVANGNFCRAFTLTGAPAISSAISGGNVSLFLPLDGSGDAQLDIVTSAETGFPNLPTTAFDGRQLLEKYSTDYVVFLRGTDEYRNFMTGAYPSVPVFENARFQVFRVMPG